MNRLRYPIAHSLSLAQLLYKSEYISQLQCAVRARAPNGHLDLRVVHGEHLRITRRRQSSSTTERVGVPMAG